MKLIHTILFTLIIGALAVSGCSTYKSKRTHLAADGTETTDLVVYRTAFKDSKAGNLSSEVMTNDRGIYTKKIGAVGISALTDEQSLQVIEEVAGSVTRGIMGSATGGVGAVLGGLSEPP